MEMIKEIFEDTVNDRYIFVTYSEDGEVSGLNFQQGLSCRINYDYFVNCRKLTEIYKALSLYRDSECRRILFQESIELFEKLF
jgi:hypothetical protein